MPPFDRHQIIDTPALPALRRCRARRPGSVPRLLARVSARRRCPYSSSRPLRRRSDYRSGVRDARWRCAGSRWWRSSPFTLVAVGAGRERLLRGSSLVGLAPLALGSVILTRFDLWPALLTVGALARSRLAAVTALAFGRSRPCSGRQGLPGPDPAARSSSTWPATAAGETVVPWPSSSPCSRSSCIPFAVAQPGTGSGRASSRQTDRPLQIESLGSSLLLAAHRLGDLRADRRLELRLAEPHGLIARSLATVLTAVQVLAVIGVWDPLRDPARLSRGAHSPPRRPPLRRSSRSARCSHRSS